MHIYCMYAYIYIYIIHSQHNKKAFTVVSLHKQIDQGPENFFFGIVASYLVHVERRIQEENERVSAYLDTQTRKPLIAVL
jgi:hypothetical protein